MNKMESPPITRSRYTTLTAATLLLLLTSGAKAERSPIMEENHLAQLEAIEYLRDVYQTEESILYPDNNIIIVFVSQPYGAGVPFILYDASLIIDQKETTTHHYTGGELDMLMNNGVQPFTITHLDPGEHQLSASQSGNLGLAGYSASTGGQQIKEFRFVKGRSPYFLHLTLTGASREFTKEGWE